VSAEAPGAGEDAIGLASDAPEAGVEIEVKLSVTDPAAILALLEHPEAEELAGFASSGALTEQLVVDRYVDTADGRLFAAGARARVRTGGARAVLALKRHGIQDGAVTARHEVEGPATDALDAERWPDSLARRELLELTGGAPLVEIARLRQRRRVRLVRRGVAEVELSLDELEALDGDRVTASRWELEAELKSGARQALQELAEVLIGLPATAPATGSKLDFALGRRPARDP
jgi:inorganic triphosphatase YgiF